MCGSQQPLEGADSGPHQWAGPFTERELEMLSANGSLGVALVEALVANDQEPKQVQCGTYIEREGVEGFCVMNPDHEGRCQLS